MRTSARRLAVAGVVSALAAGAMLAVAAPAAAQPTGITVLEGVVVQNTVGDTLTLTQTSELAIIQVTTFDLTAVETLDIVTPSASSITVFRVVGASDSDIDGTVTSTGSLVLMNPDGIELDGNGSIMVDGDLLLVAGNAPDTEFSEEDPEFAVFGGGAVEVAEGRNAGAGGSLLLAGQTITQNGFIGAGSGNVALYAMPGVAWEPATGTFIITDSTPTPAATITVGVTGYQLATGGGVQIQSSGDAPIVHDGYSEADNAGNPDGESAVSIGEATSAAFAGYATVNLADPLGMFLGAQLYLGDAVPLAFTTLSQATTGGAVPSSSRIAVAGVEIAGLETSIIQVACGLDDNPFGVHWAMATPTFGGSDIVPSLDPYLTPNQPPVEVAGLGTVWFNEQTVVQESGYDILTATALRILTEEGDELLIGTVDCGAPVAAVLPATGPESAAAPLIAATVALLAGAGLLLVVRARRTA